MSKLKVNYQSLRQRESSSKEERMSLGMSYKQKKMSKFHRMASLKNKN